ncbi:putative transposase [bacterium BMS3Abin12]|nr:putative transposase [bacterium BMS3Abin12]
MSEKRLSLTEHGQVRYTLKNPWHDGTTYVIFEPLDFIARLAALIPKPRVNLTRFNGVFAPNSQHRALITPAGRDKGRKASTTEQAPDRTPVERHMAMTWAQRLKRVFGIDIETCQACGGAMKIIACIEDPSVIRTILDHLDRLAPITAPNSLPEPRAPPPAGLFDTP